MEELGRIRPGAGGEVSVEDAGQNMEVRLEAWGLPPCEDDRYYELWLVGGEERVSAGSFMVGPSGKVDVIMNAPEFAGSYPAVGVTYEHDRDPRASDAKILSGELHSLRSAEILILTVRSQDRLTSLCLLLQQGEDEGHAGSFSWLAFGLDASAMGIGYGLGYGEAQAVARLLDVVQPVEALEDVR